MKWFRKYVPQKIRFLLGLPLLIVLAFILFAGTMFRFFMAISDMLCDGYNGVRLKRCIEDYVIDRMLK